VSIHILNQYLFNDIVIRSPLKDQMPLQPSARLASKSNGISFFRSGPRNAANSEFLPERPWEEISRHGRCMSLLFHYFKQKESGNSAHWWKPCEPLSKSIVYTCCKKSSSQRNFCSWPNLRNLYFHQRISLNTKTTQQDRCIIITTGILMFYHFGGYCKLILDLGTKATGIAWPTCWSPPNTAHIIHGTGFKCWNCLAHTSVSLAWKSWVCLLENITAPSTITKTTFTSPPITCNSNKQMKPHLLNSVEAPKNLLNAPKKRGKQPDTNAA